MLSNNDDHFPRIIVYFDTFKRGNSAYVHELPAMLDRVPMKIPRKLLMKQTCDSYQVEMRKCWICRMKREHNKSKVANEQAES